MPLFSLGAVMERIYNTKQDIVDRLNEIMTMACDDDLDGDLGFEIYDLIAELEEEMSEGNNMFSHDMIVTSTGFQCVELAPLPKVSMPCVAPCCNPVKKANKQEGNNPMNTETDLTKTRRYLTSRVYDTYYSHASDLREQFGLNDQAPKSTEEMIERIKAGDYKLDEKKAKTKGYGPTYGINWTKVDPDHDGYNDALKALATEQTNVLDKIMASDEKAGLEALEAFKTWKYSA